MPIITNKGLCHTINGYQMKEVFESSQYVTEFLNVFGDKETEELDNGHKTITFWVDMHLNYLTDRSATYGTFW